MKSKYFLNHSLARFLFDHNQAFKLLLQLNKIAFLLSFYCDALSWLRRNSQHTCLVIEQLQS